MFTHMQLLYGTDVKVLIVIISECNDTRRLKKTAMQFWDYNSYVSSLLTF